MGCCFAAPLPPWVKVENAHTPRCPHKSLLHTHTYTYSHMCSSFLSHTYAKACGPCANYACVCTLKVCLRAYGTICWKRFLMQLQKLRLNPHQEPNRAHNTYRDWRHPRRINALAEASNGLPCIRRKSFFLMSAHYYDTLQLGYRRQVYWLWMWQMHCDYILSSKANLFSYLESIELKKI